MFRKKIEFFVDKNYYTKEEIKSCIKRFPLNMPPYMKIIPPFVFDKGLAKFKKGITTVRTCAGMVNFFKRSFIYYSPWDIQILFEGNNVVSAMFGKHQDLNKHIFHSSHSNQQLLDYVPSSPYKAIIKIIPRIGADHNISYMVSNPWWHFSNIEIIPGIAPAEKGGNLNFFIPVRKNENEILIKQGTPMFVATFLTEKKVDFIFKHGPDQFKLFKTFSNLKKYMLESL